MGQAPSLPAPAARTIDFTRDIKPILQNSCVKCHGRGRSKGGFSLETRDAMLEGGDSGAALVVGESEKSHLITLVAGPRSRSGDAAERLAAEAGADRPAARLDRSRGALGPTVKFAKTAPRNHRSARAGAARRARARPARNTRQPDRSAARA